MINNNTNAISMTLRLRGSDKRAFMLSTSWLP